jgi:hypothetical protein
VNRRSNRDVVFRTDDVDSRFVGPPQGARVRRPEGEEIDDFQPFEPPSLREADAPPDRGVVNLGIGRARIEHDEAYYPSAPSGIWQSTPESIAIPAVLAQTRAS